MPPKRGCWRQKLAPHYAELELSADAAVSGPSRTPFNEETAEALREFAPPVVSFHFGLPAPALVGIVKSWGAKVISSATTVAEAQWLEAQGADAIIAQGLEAGGHRGHFLSTDICGSAGNDGAGSADCGCGEGARDCGGWHHLTVALLVRRSRWGRLRVQVGTSYLLCPEAKTSTVHRAALKEPRAGHTVVTNLFSGGLARGIARIGSFRNWAR